MERSKFRCEHSHDGLSHPSCFNQANGIHERKGCLDIESSNVSDNPKHPYETAIRTGMYGSAEEWIIVEEYDTREQAELGHGKWANLMLDRPLPYRLVDVGTTEAA